MPDLIWLIVVGLAFALWVVVALHEATIFVNRMRVYLADKKTPVNSDEKLFDSVEEARRDFQNDTRSH